MFDEYKYYEGLCMAIIDKMLDIQLEPCPRMDEFILEWNEVYQLAMEAPHGDDHISR